jgi:hypothetical protein
MRLVRFARRGSLPAAVSTPALMPCRSSALPRLAWNNLSHGIFVFLNSHDSAPSR